MPPNVAGVRTSKSPKSPARVGTVPMTSFAACAGRPPWWPAPGATPVNAGAAHRGRSGTCWWVLFTTSEVSPDRGDLWRQPRSSAVAGDFAGCYLSGMRRPPVLDQAPILVPDDPARRIRRSGVTCEVARARVAAPQGARRRAARRQWTSPNVSLRGRKGRTGRRGSYTLAARSCSLTHPRPGSRTCGCGMRTAPIERLV